MSDTPRTDTEAYLTYTEGNQGMGETYGDEVVPAAYARDLERELAETRRELAAMAAAKDNVLDALKRLDTMCRRDPHFTVLSDGRVHDGVEPAIAEAEAVK